MRLATAGTYSRTEHGATKEDHVNMIETIRAEQTNRDPRLLRGGELDAVIGGGVNHSEFSIKKLVDVATPLAGGMNVALCDGSVRLV
jgi:prepilin-type processing-associated H-X9-DG protein